MRLATNSLTTKLAAVAVLTLGLVFTLGVGRPAKAEAAAVNGANIPDSVKQSMATMCATTGNYVAQSGWLSLKDQPLVTSTTAQNGVATTIQLQWNLIVAQCIFRPLDSVFLTNYKIIRTDPNLPSLNGQTKAVSYAGLNWNTNGATPYSVETMPFSHTVTLSSSQSVTLRLYDRKINVFPPSGNLQCVRTPGYNGPADRIPSNINDFNACNDEGLSLASIDVTVTGKPAPTLIPDNSCTGITLETTGDHIDIYGPSGPLGSVTKSPDSFLLEGKVPDRTWLDLYAINGPTTQGITYKRHQWVKPADCKERYRIRLTAGLDIDNIENPKLVDFSSLAKLDNGGPTLLNGVQLTRRYYIIKYGNATPQYITNASEPRTVDRTNGVPYEQKDVDVSRFNLQAGDQICSEILTNPTSGEALADGTILTRDNPNETNARNCRRVVNRPFVSFYGADVFTGGGYAPNCNRTNQTINAFTGAGSAGAGVQFAAYALGKIDGFNSARLRGAAPTAPNGLSFANSAPEAGNFGIASRCLYDYYAHKDDDIVAKPLSAPGGETSSLSAGKWQYNGNLTLGGAARITIGDGQAVALYVNGNVTINNNIEFESAESGWSDISKVQSFYLIVRGNIYIAPGVNRIDGLYVAQPGTTAPNTASGVIYTCASNTSSHRFDDSGFNSIYSRCQGKLTINGAFQAHHVYLDRVANSLRSAGAGERQSTSSVAAEVFNYSPEMYLAIPGIASVDQSGGGSSIKSIQVLPPIIK